MFATHMSISAVTKLLVELFVISVKPLLTSGIAAFHFTTVLSRFPFWLVSISFSGFSLYALNSIQNADLSFLYAPSSRK